LASKEEAENDVRVPLHVMFYVKCWLVIQLIFCLRKRREELSRWEGEPPYIESWGSLHLFSEKGLFTSLRRKV